MQEGTSTAVEDITPMAADVIMKVLVMALAGYHPSFIQIEVLMTEWVEVKLLVKLTFLSTIAKKGAISTYSFSLKLFVLPKWE